MPHSPFKIIRENSQKHPTDFQGKPIVYDLIKTDLSEKSQEYNGYLICPGVSELKSLNLIASTSIKDAPSVEFMYSALWINQQGSQPNLGIFSRYGRDV